MGEKLGGKRVMKLNKLYILLLMGLIVSSLFLGCSDSEESTPNMVENNTAFDLELVPIDDEELHFIAQIQDEDQSGMSFMVRSLYSDWEEAFYGNIVLNSPKDTLVAQVGHLTLGDEARSYLLKVFINYEEVAFRPLGMGSYSYETEFLFSVPAGYEAFIPFALDFELPNSDYTHALTVVAFGDPHLHFSEVGAEWKSTVAMGLNFDVTYGDSPQMINLSVPYAQPISQYADKQFHSVQINQVFDISDFFQFPNYHIKVSQNEMIELAWWANPHTEEIIENYVIVAMLDWQQIEMNNKPYLLVNVEDDDNNLVDHGTFTFQAPDEVGLYEFIAFLVPNPTQPLNVNNFFPLEITQRFTIEVIN